MTDDALLRPSEAAKRIGVSTETVWRWLRKGVIPYVEVGPFRQKRIRASVVEQQHVSRGSASDNISGM